MLIFYPLQRLVDVFALGPSFISRYHTLIPDPLHQNHYRGKNS